MFRPAIRTTRCSARNAVRAARPSVAPRAILPAAARFVQTGIPNHPTTSTSTSTRPPPPPSPSPLSGYVETVEVNADPGVQIPPHTKNLISSLLDLFAGHPSIPLMAYWSPSCTLTTPLHTAQGRTQVAAQWWGYKKIMSDIKVLDHEVRAVADGGRRVEMWVLVRYEVPVVGSVEVARDVEMKLSEGGSEIESVRDMWEGGWRKVKFGEVMKKGVVEAVQAAVKVPEVPNRS